MYIAQPPLYKVKKGNSELYIKNETAFAEYITKNAINDAVLHYGSDILMEEKLDKYILKVNHFVNLITSLSRFSNLDILEAVGYAGAFDLKIFENTDLLKQKAEKMVERLNQLRDDLDAHWDYEVDYATELKLIKTHKGVKTEFVVNQTLLAKPEAVEAGKHQDDVYSIPYENMVFEKKEEKYNIKTPVELINIINQVGQKGISIQRFKGLGEMNAEQLWETTLNPENRTLLRVTIEDAAVADETFATLMGNVVEPRRDFIQENALKVVNLDV